MRAPDPPGRRPPGSAGRRLLLFAAVGTLARSANAGLAPGIILAVLAAGGSPSDGPLLVAVLTAVAALVGPVVGGTIDRLEHPRRGYVAGVALLAACAALLSIGIGQWPAGILVFVAGCAGLAQPVLTGAWSGQVRRVLPDVAPARSYAIDIGTYNAAEIVGPALVGLAYVVDAQVPGAAALEAVLILYVVALILIPLVPIPQRSATHSEPAPSLLRMLGGLRVMWRSISLRRATILGTVSFIAFALLIVAAPLLGADLGGDAGIGALLLAVVAAGALIGSLVIARFPARRRGPGTMAVLSTLALGAVLLGLSLSPTMAVAFALALLTGFIQAPQMSGVFQVRDRESPPELRGLVFVASASMRTGSFAIGSLAAAALVAAGGWRAILVAAAIVEVASVLLALTLAPPRRMRDLERKGSAT